MSKLISMPAEQYHSMKDHLSNSMLGHFFTSPAHLQAYIRAPYEQTPAQAFGELIHSSVLEPEFLDQKYVRVEEKFKMNTNVGKAAAAAFEVENPGKTPLPKEEYDQIQGIIRSVYSHDAASAFLQSGVAEPSIFWTDEKTGVKCRARLDYYRQDVAALTDVKSTNDASFRAFQRDFYNYGYYRQLAFYARGLRANGLPVERHIVIAVEKSDPYGVMVYDMDPTALFHANIEIDDALARYAECLKTNLWPSYSQEVQSIGLPAWAS